MYKALKFRIYPTKKQEKQIINNFEASRFIYNYYLEKAKTEKTNNFLNDYKKNTPNNNLKKQNQTVIMKTIFHLEDNIKKYGTTLRYKNKYERNAYTINNNSLNKIELDLKERIVNLNDIKKLKIRGYKNLKRIEGKITNACISREPNNKYYISILYELPNPTKIEPQTLLGIDLGIKKLITLSDTQTIENNKYIEKYEKRIQQKQKELSKKQKGSNNYYKCLRKLDNLYTRLRNARKYNIHKITKQITNEYDIITTENLDNKQMIMEKKLSKSLTDASLTEIINTLEYKANEKGKYLFKVDRYFPSSQKCYICGNINHKYKDLKERIYKCNKCNNEIDRDLNASINMMIEGYKMYIKSKYKIIKEF